MRSGIILIKYWFSITDEEQQFRFTMRIQDPLKQWKLSPMDVQARSRWEQYTKAKEARLEHTHLPDSPWWIVDAVDKKRARLNCISHLLDQIPYQEVQLSPCCCRPGFTTLIITGDQSHPRCTFRRVSEHLCRPGRRPGADFLQYGKDRLLAPDRRLEARECDSRGSGPADLADCLH
jgi:Polyphosphate kinase 2 (PPK2)